MHQTLQSIRAPMMISTGATFITQYEDKTRRGKVRQKADEMYGLASCIAIRSASG